MLNLRKAGGVVSECSHDWRQQLCIECGAECPACTAGPGRETAGLVCQTCGRDFGSQSVYDGWWTINGLSLLGALFRAKSGEDPEMVYAELYANSEVERP